MRNFLKTKLFKSISGLVTFCLFLTSFPKISFSQDSSPMVVAVLNFENTNKDTQNDFLSRSIPESLSTFLIKYAKAKVKVVERAQIEAILKEQGFQAAGYTDITTAVQIGKLLNASHVVIGSYAVVDKVININARLVNVETGEGVVAEEITGKTGNESFNHINRLSAKFVESLTGEKVQAETFKDVKNPFITINIPRKKSTMLWLILGVVAVTAVVVILGKSTQKTNVNVQQ